ncbi:hypothetical protein HMPREF9441_03278 [Paraprevotella clara YIT 11840]|uniref:Uncharacterized protein n=1 Tax=Paraprevotella clara YIT 11840 TaxID=762968 RepID=G5SVA6_9BACT|nr:hypothetical protein HMPREF9441_03278 [Paraprevotella clara YIT 11840]
MKSRKLSFSIFHMLGEVTHKRLYNGKVNYESTGKLLLLDEKRK